MGQDNPEVLIFTKHRKQRGGKRPMSAIVKHTITNLVNTEGIDEKFCFSSIGQFLLCAEKNMKTQGLFS